MRTCYRCKEEKPLQEFVKGKGTGGYKYQCLMCKRLENKLRYSRPEEKERVRLQTEARIKRKQDYVRTAKESSPCTDCGRFGPYYCMDYDHITDVKNFDIGQAVSQGSITLERIQDEIKLCDLVCAYCHRIRTHNRGYQRKT